MNEHQEQDDTEQAPAPEPEVAAEPATAPQEMAGDAKPAGLRFTDRTIALGQTGSGKSVLLNFLFSTAFRCQRLLLDTKDEFTVQGVEAVRSVAAIDWEAPIIHYVDHSGDPSDYNRLFQACWERRAGKGQRTYGLVVCVHELADICEHQPSRTPRWFNVYITKGRAHGLGLLGGSQRPVNMPKTARTEAQHTFAFAPGFDPDDRPVVARALRVSEQQLEQLLAQAAALSPTGEHSYLWFDSRAKRIAVRPPLPQAMIARSIVRGID